LSVTWWARLPELIQNRLKIHNSSRERSMLDVWRAKSSRLRIK
jgi:hypothetical protein